MIRVEYATPTRRTFPVKRISAAAIGGARAGRPTPSRYVRMDPGSVTAATSSLVPRISALGEIPASGGGFSRHGIELR
jgi:hypothetical protein